MKKLFFAKATSMVAAFCCLALTLGGCQKNAENEGDKSGEGAADLPQTSNNYGDYEIALNDQDGSTYSPAIDSTNFATVIDNPDRKSVV